MRSLLILLQLVLPTMLFAAATNVVPGKRIYEYPRTNSPGPLDMFPLSITNGGLPGTNMHITYLDLSNSVASSLATTNYVIDNFMFRLETFTNGTRIALSTNQNWVYGVTGNWDGLKVNLGVDSTQATQTNNLPVLLVTNLIVISNFTFSGGSGLLSGSTNFMNLSVQAAKLPAIGYPTIDAGWQDWELIYYRTNDIGQETNITATWQFVVPPDYATNSLVVNILSSIQSTNGPNPSNTVFMVSAKRFSPLVEDLHTNSITTFVRGTNVWSASFDGTNKFQSLKVALGTNTLLNAGDLAILRLTRDAMTNDTYVGATAVIGLQLEYTRK